LLRLLNFMKDFRKSSLFDEATAKDPKTLTFVEMIILT